VGNKAEIKRVFKTFKRPAKKKQPIRVLAIGDSHDGPELPDKSRFYAMGAYAKEHKVDRIIQIGDFASMDSMSSHDPNWTKKGQAKPAFKEDVGSLLEALARLDDGLGGHKATKHITFGNHEDRIARFENNNPEVFELLYEQVYELFSDFGWSYSPFGEFHFVGDVGFTHVPLNAMGKPFGGKHSENQISNDILHDVVYGHTHKAVVKHFPKAGNEIVTVMNLGCSLPEGHVEDYAKHSITGWSYGVYDITIRDGRIRGYTWVSMEELMEKYT
jgi:predicted phosphodiesterase